MFRSSGIRAWLLWHSLQTTFSGMSTPPNVERIINVSWEPHSLHFIIYCAGPGGGGPNGFCPG